MHKKAFIKTFFDFFCPQKVEKMGCHSRFNAECNTERGFKESLYIALGISLFIVGFIYISNFKPYLKLENRLSLGHLISLVHAYSVNLRNSRGLKPEY